MIVLSTYPDEHKKGLFGQEEEREEAGGNWKDGHETETKEIGR